MLVVICNELGALTFHVLHEDLSENDIIILYNCDSIGYNLFNSFYIIII